MPRILIVDDEPEIVRGLEDNLRFEGYQTVSASNGADAIALALSGAPPDLVLLDIMMPGATGLEVLERLRDLHHRESVPVVILTAKGQDADRDEAFSLGANDFVTKPFSPKKLLARIDEILEGTAEH
jgi:two-component system alkaline phosphatase synthesis response regulator PhoP